MLNPEGPEDVLLTSEEAVLCLRRNFMLFDSFVCPY